MATKAATTNGKATETTAAIQLERIPAETILVPIIGTAPLIVHRFSEKAKKQMLDAMQGRKSPKQNKDPEAEYEASRYRFADGRDGFPVLAFKAATVGAGRFFGNVTMTTLRQSLFFHGEEGQGGDLLVPVTGTPRMREDVARVARGGTDLRYRAEFPAWSATLSITYVSSMLTRESVLALVDAGGMGVGVGEWRPEKSGQFGTYQVDPDRDIEVLSK